MPLAGAPAGLEFHAMSAEPAGDLARVHAEWEEVNTQLRRMEQVLSDALDLYARRQAGRPNAVVADVECLRPLCAARCDALLAAIKNTW